MAMILKLLKKESNIPLIIFLITIIWDVILFSIADRHETYDTISYFDAWYDSLSLGKPDIFRTPLYPCILGFASLISGSRDIAVLVVIAFQIILCAFSATWLYQTSRLLAPDKKNLSVIIALIYSLYPTTGFLTHFILTESISISLMNGLLLLITRCWFKGYNFYDGLLILMTLLSLLFIRPSFLFLIIALGIYWIIWIFRYKSNGFKLLISFVIPVVCLFMYSIWMKETYGVFAISKVSVHNRYQILRQNNNADLDAISNPEIRSTFKEYFKLENQKQDNLIYSKESNDIMSKYGWKEYDKAVAECVSSNYLGFLDGTISRLKREYNKPVVAGAPSVIYRLWTFVSIPFSAIIWLCIFFGAILIKYRNIKNWEFWFILWLIAMGNLSVTILGAQNSFARLSYTSVGDYLLLFFFILSSIHFKVPIDSFKSVHKNS